MIQATPNYIYYPHYDMIPADVWRWPNFTPKEIASSRVHPKFQGDNSIIVHFESLDKLQAARNLAGKPFHINSGYRDPKYNKAVGGEDNSYHPKGQAFDISLQNFTKKELYQILEDAGFTGFGLTYENFIHADTGRPRRW